MKKKLLIRSSIIWILFSLPGNSYSQDVSATFELAENSCNAGNFKEAIYYYQRILCFGTDAEKTESYINTANCYFELSDYDKAYELYELAYYTVQNDSLKKEMLFKKAITLLNEKRYNLALLEILEFDCQNDKYFTLKKEIYLGITYFLLDEFEKSEKHIMNYVNLSHIENSEEYEQLFIENSKIKRGKIKTAVILSCIIPGLGQMYAGDFKNAVNSALLNASLLGIAILIGYNYGIIDAVVTISPWLLRYYSGGIKKVENIAQRKIADEKQKIYNELLRLLKENDN